MSNVHGKLIKIEWNDKVMAIKHRIFEQIKTEMIDNIQATTLDNLSESISISNQLYEYAQLLNQTPDLKDHPKAEDDETPIPSEPTKRTVEESNQTTEPVNQHKGTGILHRNLHHGYLKTKGDDVFIPETIIRSNNFQHGDIISYEYLYTKDDNKHYKYRLYKKSEPIPNASGECTRGEQQNRTIFERGIVERDVNGNLVVRVSEDNTRFKDVQHTFMYYSVPDNEISQYSLTPNSIVDIGWYNNNIENSIRIVWKHYRGS